MEVEVNADEDLLLFRKAETNVMKEYTPDPLFKDSWETMCTTLAKDSDEQAASDNQSEAKISDKVENFENVTEQRKFEKVFNIIKNRKRLSYRFKKYNDHIVRKLNNWGRNESEFDRDSKRSDNFDIDFEFLCQVELNSFKQNLNTKIDSQSLKCKEILVGADLDLKDITDGLLYSKMAGDKDFEDELDLYKIPKPSTRKKTKFSFKKSKGKCCHKKHTHGDSTSCFVNRPIKNGILINETVSFFLF